MSNCAVHVSVGHPAHAAWLCSSRLHLSFLAAPSRPAARLQTVITPHIYPPSITMSTFLGNALWEQSRIAFGYLQTQGYCSDGRCQTFPIMFGEVGSAFETQVDKQWLQDFADFCNAEVGGTQERLLACLVVAA